MCQLQVEVMLPLCGLAGMPATRSMNDRLFMFVNMRPVAFVDVTKVNFLFFIECFSLYQSVFLSILSLHCVSCFVVHLVRKLICALVTVFMTVCPKVCDNGYAVSVCMLQLLREYFTQTLPSSDVVRYPIAFLHLTVPPANIDVNLEPNKSRVLLHNKVLLVVLVHILGIALHAIVFIC